MRRLTAAMATAAASAAMTAAAVGAGTLPALAAARPVSHAANRATAHKITTREAAARRAAARTTTTRRVERQIAPGPVRIGSQYGTGQYVSVVSCEGKKVPPPVRLGMPDMPLHVTGGTPSYAVARAMAMPGRYKTVYSCTLVVKKEIQMRPGKGGGLKHVTLNTGFGGAAHSVSRHHPER